MKSSVALFICLFSLTVAAQQPAPKTAASAHHLLPRRPLRLRRRLQPRRRFHRTHAIRKLGGQPVNIRLDVSVI